MAKQLSKETAAPAANEDKAENGIDRLWRQLAGPCPTNPKHTALRIWSYDAAKKLLACCCDTCGADWLRPHAEVAEDFARVRYQAIPCPADAAHGEMRVYTVKPLVRYLRCETCGKTAKAPGTVFDPPAA